MDLFLENRHTKVGRIVFFVKLYRNHFEIQGSGPNIKVFVAKAPEPRPATARPAQVGGASSSSDQAPRERQPRAIEIDPRAPYRRFPNDQKVEWSMEKIQLDRGHLDTGGMKNTRWLLQRGRKTPRRHIPGYQFRYRCGRAGASLTYALNRKSFIQSD